MPRIRENASRYQDKDFARYIAAQLAMNGMKQHDLAVELEISDSGVTYMLRNPKAITVERLRKLIACLRLEPAEVLKFCGMKGGEV